MTNHEHSTKNKSPLKFFIPVLLLVLIATSCNLPLGDTGNTPATEPGQAEEKDLPDSPAPPANTAPPDTLAPTPSPTATIEPTVTATSTPTPYVMVSGNTNCRYGPGSVYDWLHTYLAGDQALLVGKSADEAFWYTSDQNGILPDCWLWGKYATPVGDTALLPVFTPPPTPTPRPDFAVSYEGSDCGAGSCWLWFKIDNTGSIKWESVLVYAKNIVTSDVSVNVSNTFLAGIAGSDIAYIPAGDTGYTHSERLLNPSGNTIDVFVIACEKDDLTEICQARHLTVNP